jgi:uncharacterized protein YndB with AHSA1/START domain
VFRFKILKKKLGKRNVANTLNETRRKQFIAIGFCYVENIMIHKYLKSCIMEKIHFSTTINAPKEKVWSVLWDRNSYPKWTKIFAEGSDAITDWQEGSKVLFVSGSGEGMVSRIETRRPNEFMRFEHLGVVKNNIEDTESEEVKQWAGAMESYTLTEANGKTQLKVDMDITEEYKDYFLNTWPRALEEVKQLSE